MNTSLVLPVSNSKLVCLNSLSKTQRRGNHGGHQKRKIKRFVCYQKYLPDNKTIYSINMVVED